MAAALEQHWMFTTQCTFMIVYVLLKIAYKLQLEMTRY